MAFTDEGEFALPPASKRSGAAKRKRAKALHALTLNTALAYQRIGLRAAEGDERACDQLIRIVHDGHAMLQPSPAEAKQGSQGPIFPDAIVRYQEPASPPQSLAPAFEQRSTVIGPDGTEYVEGPPP